MIKQELPKSQQCLNCGYEVISCKYCPECGQENIEYRVETKLLIRYYMAKYLRFDVKWLITLKILVLRPWYLTQVYLEGKRKQYTHPFRLYLVLSVLFFLGLRLQINTQETNKNNTITFKSGIFSLQTDRNLNINKIMNQVTAQLPNAMLISVPLVALVLAAFYYHKKKYFFIDHFVLMLHYYAYVYLISLPFLFIPQIQSFSFISFIFASVYLWLFIKFFYQESTWISTIKYIFFTIFSTAIVTGISILLVLIIIFKEILLN